MGRFSPGASAFHSSISTNTLCDKPVGRYPKYLPLRAKAVFAREKSDALREILTQPPLVLAAGGGVIERVENRQMLRDQALCVWLRVPIEVVLERVGNDPNRPLLQNDPGFVRTRRLYAAREPLYAEADIHIDATRSPEETVETIVAALRVRRAGQTGCGNG